ncbi:ribosomal protein S18-alanine N-acetyltransferase [Dongshaea marina]|uniref:ribosomal protein S18-alanine N-acetyltransferase n=1 Tax=Dongshaea marina TaxID=2047966 RepID=UPI000D3E0AFF|nr:ribosomal protein S18-alanine N-acetyltransferase [Dongshaea marina]
MFNICIAPAFRRRGLGRQLLEHLIGQLKQKKADLLWLEVRRSNQAALNLYQELGFESQGVRKDYYPAESGREDALVMRLTLPQKS